MSAGPLAAEIQVTDPYARAVPAGQRNSAAFMVLSNHSGEDRALVAAESPVAETVELHTHVMADGMMQMRRIERIDIPAGGTATLAPGGLHIMLIGLGQPLDPGTDIDLELRFDDGETLDLEVPVRRIEMGQMHRSGTAH
ncbi:copper chaperone PCu(A)C [Imhoffiella purpurea]|uniref:copper chaperone PCu(A)C n=1 Tax=Imhoffiella purpurea TaxID=1249627 RepID=UPI001E44216C|nr:copper chaperone PCu(A)C [Imhoffiella purpurea]